MTEQLDSISNILVVNDSTIANLGFEVSYANTPESALSQLGRKQFALVIYSLQVGTAAQQHRVIESLPETSLLILIHRDSTESRLWEHLEAGFRPVFHILDSFENSQLQSYILDALETHAGLIQQQQLLELVADQNKNLAQLTMDLEDRVSKRQINLTRTRRKLELAHQRYQILHELLVAIFKIKSVPEIEQKLVDLLKKNYPIAEIRLASKKIESPVLSMPNVPGRTTFSSPLICGQDVVGHIYFIPTSTEPFKKSAEQFFLQISEIVALCLDRLIKADALGMLKNQWQSTLDAIIRPVSLMSRDYMVYSANRTYLERAGQNLGPQSLPSRCYELLFNRSSPCEGCVLGEKFHVTDAESSQIYAVSSHRITRFSDSPSYVNWYRDVTTQRQLERKVTAATASAELGIVSSSIAHELNNPLGGMLSFLYLIKNECPKESPLWPDIVAIEEGALRCKEIVENLLGFSRQKQDEDPRLLDINNMIQDSLERIRPSFEQNGISVLQNESSESANIYGQASSISQLLTILFSFWHPLLHRPPGSADSNNTQVRISTAAVEPAGIKLEIVLYGSQELLEKIYQLTRTNPVDSPMIINLAIARQIAHQHLGEIGFKLTPGSLIMKLVLTGLKPKTTKDQLKN